MSFTYTTQVAGYSLTAETLGNDGNYAYHQYTFQGPAALGEFVMYVYYTDGTQAVGVYDNVVANAYTWAPTSASMFGYGFKDLPITRIKIYKWVGLSISTLWIDAEWTGSNRGENQTGFDDVLFWFDANDPYGYGVRAANNATLEVWRDLSGNENTVYQDGPYTNPDYSADSGDENPTITVQHDQFGAGEDGVYFPQGSVPTGDRVERSAWMQSYREIDPYPASWTAYIRYIPWTDTNQSTLKYAISRPLLGSVWYPQYHQQFAIYGIRTSNTSTQECTHGGAITASSYDPINWPYGKPYAAVTASSESLDANRIICVCMDAGVLTTYVDGVELAQVTVPSPTRTDRGIFGINGIFQSLSLKTTYNTVAMFTVAHDEQQRRNVERTIGGYGVNLTPAPGGIVTANASGRTRVKGGVQVRPDGGSP